MRCAIKGPEGRVIITTEPEGNKMLRKEPEGYLSLGMIRVEKERITVKNTRVSRVYIDFLLLLQISKSTNQIHTKYHTNNTHSHVQSYRTIHVHLHVQ